jgi:hypothetical protein
MLCGRKVRTSNAKLGIVLEPVRRRVRISCQALPPSTLADADLSGRRRLPHVVIEATGLSISPHGVGIMLTILAGGAVAANVKLSASLAEQLTRGVRDAQQIQRVRDRVTSVGDSPA